MQRAKVMAWAGWLCCLPLLPLVLLQALLLKKRIVRLPEAQGARFVSGPGDRGGAGSILVLGESTAVGVGALTHEEALPGFLARGLSEQLGHEVGWSIVGKNGATIQRVLRCLSEYETRPHATAFVFLGVNDVFHLSSVKSWCRSIRALEHALVARGVEQIIFSCVPPISRFSGLPQPLRAVLGARAKLLDVYLNQTLASSKQSHHRQIHFPHDSTHLAQDGVHPSIQGYQTWAQQMIPPLPAPKGLPGEVK